MSRFTTNPYSKPLLLLYLTLALVFLGATGIFAVSRESFYEAVWEAIAGPRSVLSLRDCLNITSAYCVLCKSSRTCYCLRLACLTDDMANHCWTHPQGWALTGHLLRTTTRAALQ